jgi:hypothetical protein
MFSLLPIRHILRKRLMRREPLSLASVASRTWEIAPAETTVSLPAYCLPGQLDRVTGWAFANEHPRKLMEGGLPVNHGATRGFLLKDAFLIDGVLYKGDACKHLRRRRHRVPELRVEREIERAAMFCSEAGNAYFGQWLIDDCPTYPLAAAEGEPVMTNQPLTEHTLGYEDWLDMKPTRLESAFFRELVVFDDMGQNQNKRQRFRALGRKLLSHVEAASHPGIFILRGTTGQRRVLKNELELAERLRDQRGFRILEPPKHDVPGIVKACAGAKVVIGVEGSGLIHGAMTVQPGAAMVTLQPPQRFVTVFSQLVDGLHFGFVVGAPDGGEDFRIDPTEVERTLDLLPA